MKLHTLEDRIFRDCLLSLCSHITKFCVVISLKPDTIKKTETQWTNIHNRMRCVCVSVCVVGWGDRVQSSGKEAVGSCFYGPIPSSKRQTVYYLGGWGLQQCSWPSFGHTESMSVRGFPTIPCVVLTAQAKCFLSCFVQLPYYTDILRQRMLSAVVLQKFAAGSRGAHPIYGSWRKAAFAGPSLPGDMYSSCDVNAHEHKVVYLFYLLPVYKEGSMLCVVDPLQSPHNEPPGHAGVQDQVVWTSSP